LTPLVGHPEEHLACKILSDEVLADYLLERGANDSIMVQLMPVPPHHLLFIKIQIGLIFLVLAYPGCPGKEAIKRVFFVSVCLVC